MLYSLIMIILGFEIIDFLLKSIIPNSKIDSTISSAISMIVFSGIVVLCVQMIVGSDFSIFRIGDLIWTDDISQPKFNDYINIYKEIISSALE